MTELDALQKKEAYLDEVLVEMEEIGWPCRLVELPKRYARVTRELDEMRRWRNTLLLINLVVLVLLSIWARW